MPILSKAPTPCGTCTYDEGSDRTGRQPVRRAEARSGASVRGNTIANDVPKDHVDSECDSGNKEGEGGGECHENGANAVVGESPACAKYDGKEAETSAYGVC